MKVLWLMHCKNYNFSVILCGYGTWFYLELQTKTDGVLEQNAKKNIWTPNAREQMTCEYCIIRSIMISTHHHT